MKSMWKAAIAVMAGVMLTASTATAQEEPCPEDLTCSGAIGVQDLLELISNWGPCPGCAADLNGDGMVGVPDLLILINAWGPCLFEYPSLENEEAEQIGLEMLGEDGPLLIPHEYYQRIVQDLEAIRNEIPELEDVIHSPKWIPNQLIVRLESDMKWDTYECLNTFYKVVEEDHLFGDWYVITFAGNLNIEAVRLTYLNAPEITAVDPNFLIGGDNTWSPTPGRDGVWHWDIADGFHDCFDGCDCWRLYEVETTEEGKVTLLSYEEIGLPWCEF